MNTTMRKVPFSVVLTSAEVSWLAGVLGLTHLELPISFPHLSENELHQVQESLSARNLVKRNPGAGWQVDRLVIFLVQLLGTAENYVKVETHSREKDPSLAAVFSRENIHLLVPINPEQIWCHFYSDKEALQSELLRSLEIDGMRAGLGEYFLPDPITFFKIAGLNKEAIPHALKVAGFTMKDMDSTGAWLKTLQKVILLQSINIDPEAKPGARLWLCGNEKELWAAEMDESRTEHFHFQPCTFDNARAKILKTI